MVDRSSGTRIVAAGRAVFAAALAPCRLKRLHNPRLLSRLRAIIVLIRRFMVFILSLPVAVFGRGFWISSDRLQPLPQFMQVLLEHITAGSGTVRRLAQSRFIKTGDDDDARFGERGLDLLRG